MYYVVSQLWVVMLSVFIVGVLTAVLVRQPEERRWIAPWLKWAILASMAAAAVATISAVVGRAGLYVESGLASFVAFLLGCFIGTRLTGGSLREHKGWALGLVPAIMIWLIGNAVMTPRVEADLKKRVGKAIEVAGGDPAKLEVAGRDVTLPEDAPNRPALIDATLDVDGVRLVTGVDKQKEASTERKEEKAPAEPETDVAPSDNRTDEITPAQSEAAPGDSRVGETVPPVSDAAPGDDRADEKTPPQPNVASGDNNARERVRSSQDGRVQQQEKAAPPVARQELAPAAPEAIPLNPPSAAAELAPSRPLEPENLADHMRPVADVSKLPAAGGHDAAPCQAALSANLAKDKIKFGAGNAKIPFTSASVLDKIAAVLKRCPGTKFEIAVYPDGKSGENAALAQKRAKRLVDYLEREGVEPGRLVGVGYGKRTSPRPSAGKGGGSANRNVEFLIK
jgi:outer membrane protein OmpA-like peptidoglycan-associated protein